MGSAPDPSAVLGSVVQFRSPAGAQSQEPALLPALKSQFLLEKSKWFEVTFFLFSFLTKIFQLVRKFVAMLLPSGQLLTVCVL